MLDVGYWILVGRVKKVRGKGHGRGQEKCQGKVIGHFGFMMKDCRVGMPAVLTKYYGQGRGQGKGQKKVMEEVRNYKSQNNVPLSFGEAGLALRSNCKLLKLQEQHYCEGGVRQTKCQGK